MDLNDIKEVLEQEEITKDFIVAEKDGNEYQFYNINVSPDILEELENTLINIIEKQEKRISEGKTIVAEYSTANSKKDKNHIQKIGLDDIPEFEKMTDISEEREFENGKIENLDPEFQCFRIKSSEGIEIVAIKNFTNRQIIGNKKFNIIFSDDIYNKFEKNLIQLPNKFDVIIWDNNVIILGPNNFERIFNFIKQFREAAKDVREYISDSDIDIEDQEKVFDKIEGNKKVVRKMHEVSQNEYYKEMTMEDMIDRINNYNLEGVRINEDEEGNKKLRVTDFRKVWDFVKLLNDDFLISNVTENKYGVNSKEER